MLYPDPLSTIAEVGVVPVVTIDRLESALPLADALLAGRLPIIEITFRTAVAADAMRLLSFERPQILVGAGTILTQENLGAARRYGARFGVAPGTNPKIVAEAVESSLPFIPGVATPSEVESALHHGCRLLKLFPSEALGGPAYLQALSGPYAHTGVRWMPSGGVTAENMADYLNAPLVAAIGGGWIAPRQLLDAENFAEISRRARIAVDLVASLRDSE